MIFPEKMVDLGKNRSVIRELFEYGNKRKTEIGKDNVFDFSLGNPSVDPPKCVNESIIKLLTEKSNIELHGYTSAPGDFEVRTSIAEYINKSFGTALSTDNIYMTVGAAASLTISLNAICKPGNEVITFAPFFPEYRVFVENAGANLVVCPLVGKNFDVDFDMFEKSINKNTRAVIINSPNNPSGVVLSEETIKKISDILQIKEKEYKEPIYIIADEPYRELTYGAKVPYIMNYYDDTIVCYSFSKSLSLPGERLGYIAVCNKAKYEKDLFAAICGAGRALGFVCAPSLFQRVCAMCLGKTSDISVYKTNRDLLYNSLTKFGFECVHPDGAFYLFMKSPIADANEFSEFAKKYELLLVPSDSFGMPGYVRISYCVDTDMIKHSLSAFEKLAKDFSLIGE